MPAVPCKTITYGMQRTRAAARTQPARFAASRRVSLVRAVGDTMFLCPPLVITEDEIDALFDLVRKALDKTAIELGV